MILSECAVFAAMLFSGFLAGAVTALFFTLGKGSAVAGAIFDFLCPLTVGAIYLCSLRLAASGVFRIYSLAAFAAGILLLLCFLRRFSPAFKRMARRIVLPIKSLSESLEKQVSARLAPIAERRRLRREKRRERKRGKRLSRKKRSAKDHPTAPRKKKKPPAIKGKRSIRKRFPRTPAGPKRHSLFPPPFGQKH